FRELLTDEGHAVETAPSAEEALRLAGGFRPDAVILDVRLPGADGLTSIRRLREQVGDVPVIVITAFGNLETAVRAVREGAFDYLTKPFDLAAAAAVVRRALRRRVEPAPATPPDLAPGPDTLVGSSPQMQEVFKRIALAAPSDVPVLITGESGTGKELVARALHRHGRRADGPFVPICLAALSPHVVESELFGHLKGAFTGAEVDRKGMLELADGGTVFLDEIGDVPPPIQVKLLRAVELGEVTPVGGARPRRTDFRVVAATNRPLPELIATGAFREDLYYRLAVFPIELPPLRERRGDIPELAEHFLRQLAPRISPRTLSPAARRELASRPWYGNVRELRNAVEHAAIVARGGDIGPEALPPPLAGAPGGGASPEDQLRKDVTSWARERLARGIPPGGEAAVYEELLRVVEPALLAAVLAGCNNNRAAAARLLGMHRATLRQKLRQYGFGEPERGDGPEG
ncbi:MAG TPA: sigma-54 dependent transcriptional regulator, partial [Gemmataceae bacterium]